MGVGKDHGSLLVLALVVILAGVLAFVFLGGIAVDMDARDFRHRWGGAQLWIKFGKVLLLCNRPDLIMSR